MMAIGAVNRVGTMHNTVCGRRRRICQKAMGADVTAKDKGAISRQILELVNRARLTGHRCGGKGHVCAGPGRAVVEAR